MHSRMRAYAYRNAQAAAGGAARDDGGDGLADGGDGGSDGDGGSGGEDDTEQGAQWDGSLAREAAAEQERRPGAQNKADGGAGVAPRAGVGEGAGAADASREGGRGGQSSGAGPPPPPPPRPPVIDPDAIVTVDQLEVRAAFAGRGAWRAMRECIHTKVRACTRRMRTSRGRARTRQRSPSSRTLCEGGRAGRRAGGGDPL